MLSHFGEDNSRTCSMGSGCPFQGGCTGSAALCGRNSWQACVYAERSGTDAKCAAVRGEPSGWRGLPAWAQRAASSSTFLTSG